jgi:hypothetical protein
MVVGASSSLTYRQFSTSFITRETNAAGITTPVFTGSSCTTTGTETASATSP